MSRSACRCRCQPSERWFTEIEQRSEFATQNSSSCNGVSGGLPTTLPETSWYQVRASTGEVESPASTRNAVSPRASRGTICMADLDDVGEQIWRRGIGERKSLDHNGPTRRQWCRLCRRGSYTAQTRAECVFGIARASSAIAPRPSGSTRKGLMSTLSIVSAWAAANCDRRARAVNRAWRS